MLMQRGGNQPPQYAAGANSYNYRVPPGWGPDQERNYTFRAWSTDVRLWSMVTDLNPRQQTASIVMRLTGGARESARALTQQELDFGGVFQGQLLDPVTYLLTGLRMRFAPLADESRIAAMNEFMAFKRHAGEGINPLLVRFELARQRAHTEGNYVLSIEGCALFLLRICHISPQQFMTFTQPFGGRLPNTEAEFRDMMAHMRRLCHIWEHLSLIHI